MSEELNGVPAVDESVGTIPTADSTGGEAGRQPETAGKIPAKAITDEDFRKYQANADRRYESARKEAEAARQQAQQLQQQLQSFTTQWEQQQYQALPEEQRPHFENQRLRSQMQILQQQMQQSQIEQMKWQALRQMQQQAAEDGVNVTIDELADQPNPDAAWRYIVKKSLTSSPARQQARQEKAEANAVDLGGGPSITPASDYQNKYDRAAKNMNAKEMLDILYDATAAGVELKV